MRALIKAVAICVAIPAFTFAISWSIIANVDADLIAAGYITSGEVCQLPEVQGDAKTAGMCDELATIRILQLAALIGAAIPLGLLFTYFVASKAIGRNRQLIAVFFPPLIAFSLIAIAITVAIQGIALTFAAYFGESYAIGRVHFLLIGGIGLGAGYAALQLISSLGKLGKPLAMSVTGKSLTPSDAPKLFSFVSVLADKLSAKRPINIVVGLDPTFFVTNCNVKVRGEQEQEPLTGETLFISAPLSRLLSEDEFAAVVGHELGHFRGGDTEYSLRFAPVFAGLHSAITSLQSSDQGGASDLAKLPAIAILSVMYANFARNEAAISREREHEADRAGAQASSAMALATALMKVTLFAPFWNSSTQRNIDRLEKGLITKNLSRAFFDRVRFDVERERIPAVLADLLDQRIPHPTDSHPKIAERLRMLNVDPSSITPDLLLAPTADAAHLVDNLSGVEEELTWIEHKIMVATRQALLPKEEDNRANLAIVRAASILAATLVVADGSVDVSEIATAESIAFKLMPNFDDEAFRDIVRHPGEYPTFSETVEAMKGLLSPENLQTTYRFLVAIAEANCTIDGAEAALLAEAEQAWNLGSEPN